MRKKFQHVLLLIDSAPCHLTKKVHEFCAQNGVIPFFVPPRLTNLLQPADVCWFSSIKKTYKEKWNNWFIYGEKSFTKNNNMRSVGYEQCLNWLIEAWDIFPTDLIKKSFITCGINRHTIDENSNVLMNIQPFHTILKQMLNENQVFHDYVDLDHELVDANDQINENDELIFEANDCQQPNDDSDSESDMDIPIQIST